MGSQTVFAEIASGGTVSGTFAVKGADVLGIWAPTVTSGDMFVQGNFGTVAGNYVRLLNALGSGDFTAAIGLGSRAITVAGVFGPFPHGRIEMSVAQTDTRTFAITAKF